MADLSLPELNAKLEQMSSRLKSSSSEAANLSQSFSEFANSIFPAVMDLKSLQFVFEKQTSGLKQAFHFLGQSNSDILSDLDSQITRITALEKSFKEVTGATVDQRAVMDAIIAREKTMLKHQEELYQKRAVLAVEEEKAGNIKLGLLKASLIQLASAYKLQKDFNNSVVESTSVGAARLWLFEKTLAVQRETGVSFSEASHAAKALVKYGMDNEASFEANAKIVAQLNESLGMSVDTAAELAVITERQTKGSFKSLGDVIATITDQTSLAADEIGRIGINIQKTIAVLGPGNGAALSGVVRAISMYEASLKEITGHAGGVEKLLSQLGTPEGMTQAQLLGVSPDALRTAAGVELIMTNFAKVAKDIVGISSGADRMFRLDILAKQFNLTAYEAESLIQTVERRRNQQVKELTLEERYKNQMQDAGKAGEALYNSLHTLVSGAFYPFAVAITALMQALNWAVTKLISIRPVAYTAMAAIAIGFVTVSVQLWGVAKAFLAVAASAKIAAMSLREKSVADITTAITGRFGSVAGSAATSSLRDSILASAAGPSLIAKYLPTLVAMSAKSLIVLSAAVGVLAIGITALSYWTKRKEEKNLEKTLADVKNYMGAKEVNLALAQELGAYVRDRDTTKTQEYSDKVFKRIEEIKATSTKEEASPLISNLLNSVRQHYLEGAGLSRTFVKYNEDFRNEINKLAARPDADSVMQMQMQMAKTVNERSRLEQVYSTAPTLEIKKQIEVLKQDEQMLVVLVNILAAINKQGDDLAKTKEDVQQQRSVGDARQRASALSKDRSSRGQIPSSVFNPWAATLSD